MAFVQEYYKIPWDQVHAFDLVINTGKISPDLAVTWLVDAIKALDVIPAPKEPKVSSIEVDDILKTAVSNALKCKSTHS
jgi:hypothetical protein